MKLTTIIILTSLMTVSATGLAQRVTLNQKHISLKQIFNSINKQTGYSIIWSPKKVNGSQIIDVNFNDAELNAVLDLVLEKQQLTYTIEDKTVIIEQKKREPSFLDNVKTAFTAIDVHGRVVDEKGNALPGVNVKLKDGSQFTITSKDGSFALKQVSPKAIVVISFVGYITRETNAGPELGTITLTVSNSNLDEVQVIAYGTTTRRLATGDIGTVKSDDIQKQPVDNPLLALEGRLPGVQITQSTGLPGTGVTIRVRGQNSLYNGNDPLYIIDGVPYTSQLLKNLGNILGGSGNENQGIYGSALSFINPSDIESIDVLKDADATAIYGSRAANGAVLITTKKGKSGETTVNFTAQSGLGRITRSFDLLDRRQYLDMRYEALKNDHVAVGSGIGGDIDLAKWDTTRSTDWQKQLIGGTAKYDNIQAGVSGGNATTQYLVGTSYQKQTTVFPGDFSDQKVSLHFNINSASANQKFRILLSGNYMDDNNRLLQSDLTRNIYLAPVAPQVYNSDGTLNWANSTWVNPYASLLQKYNNHTTNLVSNATVSYQLLHNLSLKTNLGYNSLLVNELNTLPFSSVDPAFWGTSSRQSNFTNNSSRSWIIEPQANYSASLWEGTIDVLAGATFQQDDNNGQIFNANGFLSDQLMEDPLSADPTNSKITSTTISRYRYTAFFGRINYNINDQYILNFTGRRDGSSRFGPERRFHDFGAVGAAWIFSQSGFIKHNLPVISFGKLRVSYGTTGSDQIGDYRYLDLYTSLPSSYQNGTGLYINNLFNPLLAWEETRKKEAGFELSLFKGRVSTAISYYLNKTSNQLTAYSLPSVTGFSSIETNQDATVANSGWELALNTVNVKTKDFQWNTSFNITINKNKLVSVGPGVLGIDNRNIGQPLGTFFVYDYAGVDKTTGAYQFRDKNGNLTSSPGFDDATIPENLSPKFFGGFQNAFRYKSVSFDMLFQFVKQIGQNNQFGNYPGGFYFMNQPTSVLARWQRPGDVTNIQRYNQDFSLNNGYNIANSSNAAYTDASFIRLKNVSLSWQVPEPLVKKIHFRNARVFVNGQNLLTFTGYKGSDPESRSLYSLPPLKVCAIGVQVGI
ncbi:TonB-linked SusC/RagA family outer membrane protein [Mucilaginibacter gracilis]|uniref:TonB-linked SusC/RagA family outer membrane protein n=1 Tax=Mucilaginibacter gracilis TaxID=423350 RepID=A0A495ITC5_9SPHI|nr:SusC/RagA family TonB-linked outer membrane protein [Mucilaginibacter gracilis]RKR80007.1 TonB-linked SusC/RagA family outer membrane protein [Mucilaginibacter gracilis]